MERLLSLCQNMSPPIGRYLDVYVQILREQRFCTTDLQVVRTQMICLLLAELRDLHPNMQDTTAEVDRLS